MVWCLKNNGKLKNYEKDYDFTDGFGISGIYVNRL